MADEGEDPREVPWHPRLSPTLVGHQPALQQFKNAIAGGKPHHAWLIAGGRGIGKATFAYAAAAHVLGLANPAQTSRWIASRAHPDLFVLERSLTDSKPRRLRQEIVVDDARKMAEFFARTSASGGWRIALVDSADDLNTEAANALLKLVEEPPPKALILLLSHQPGRLLRTLRSRCRRLALSNLTVAQATEVIEKLPLTQPPNAEDVAVAASLAQGSPGRALELLQSAGAKAFHGFLLLKALTASSKVAIAGAFSQRQAAVQDFEVFADLLLNWLAEEATRSPESPRARNLSEVHAEIAAARAVTAGYNLDRRVAVLAALTRIEDALKTA